MLDSCKESTIQQDDWGQLAADGGSNAIGSIRKFELVTQSEDGGRGQCRFQHMLFTPE
jgi:hypothetical protein